MAYISTEEVKVIREELKKNFPSKDGWKFSIVKRDFLSLNIIILSAPVEIRNDVQRTYEQVNKYRLEGRREELKRIFEIANRNNYDYSDVQSDYFDVGFYLNISIGSYDKPFVLKKC